MRHRRQRRQAAFELRVRILPYIEEEQLYKQFKLDEPWDSEHNKALLDQMPAVYANPSSPSEDQTTYLLPVGVGTAWSKSDGPSIKEIRDGTANTVMLLEIDPEKAVEWTKPIDLEIDPDDPFTGLGHLPAGPVFRAAFFDGSVRQISVDVDRTQFLRLLDPRDGNVVEIP